MTHAEALEHHRRQLHSEPECHRELVSLGPDGHLDLCTLWACPACGGYLSIDPTGVIRDRGPVGILPCTMRARVEVYRCAMDPRD